MKLSTNDERVSFLFGIIFCWFLLTPLFKFTETGELISRVIGVFVVIFATALVLMRPPKKLYYGLFIASFLFILYCFLHIFYEASIYSNVATFIRIYGSFALLFAFLSLESPTAVVSLESKVFYLGVACAAYVIIQGVIYAVSPQFAIDIFGKKQFWGALGESVRPRGLLGSVGGSASLIATSIVVYIKRKTISSHTSYHQALFFVLLFGLFLVFTRTFILTLVVFVFLYFLFLKKFDRISLAVILGVGIFIGYSSYAPEKLEERLSDIPFISEAVDGDKTELLKGRFYLSRLAWDKFVGPGGGSWLYGTHLNFSTDAISSHYDSLYDDVQTSTHNDLVWLLVNLGVIGLLLYFLFLYRLWALCSGGSPNLAFLTSLYIVLFFFASSLAGESINITGHRYIQMIVIALFLCQIRHSRRSIVEPITNV